MQKTAQIHNLAQTLGSGKNPELIKLALDTLGGFDFSGMLALQFYNFMSLDFSQGMS